MAFPSETNTLASVSSSQTLAAGGHAARHNELKAAIESIRDILGGSAQPTGTISVTGNTATDLVRITQTGAGNALVVEDAANPDSTPFVIDASGNVGIGTGSPSGRLHVAAEGGTNMFSDAGASYNGLYFRRANTSLTSPSIVADGNPLGEIGFWGYDGAAYRAAARIRGSVDAAPGSSDMPGRLMFLTTADGGTTETERMRIDNAGLITGTGTSLGEWTAYTPALTGTGWDIGNGTIAGYYCQIGKNVIFKLRVTFGSTSTYGAGTYPRLSLPLTARNLLRQGSIGALCRDTSLTSNYVLATVWVSTTTVGVQVIGTNGLLSDVSSTSPFTWASGDFIDIAGIYEAA